MRFLLQCRSRRRAFTVLEVVLAIGIAVGILVVALHFYRQAAELRAQLLRESERVAALRLVMDRLCADLRGARPHDWYGFTGTRDSVNFVKADLTLRSARRPDEPTTDLRRVIYQTASALDGTNTVVTGLMREEKPLIEPRAPSKRNLPAEATETASTTNIVVIEPTTDAIRFLRFRFWDGSAWVDGWDDIVPPRGVEVSLGAEPLPDESISEEYPFEQFRRVIVVPGGSEAKEFDWLEASPSEPGSTTPEAEP